MLPVRIYLAKSLGPDYLLMHLAKLKTQGLQFFANTMRKMKEEMQFEKGSRKLSHKTICIWAGAAQASNS